MTAAPWLQTDLVKGQTERDSFMPERDTASQPFHDLISAFGLLTRLPMPSTSRHRPEAAWCWPIIGGMVAVLSVMPALFIITLGAPPASAAIMLLMLSILLTGAMHEDGLADTADGLFGGWTPERRLEIMKDSHIGSYGTLALITVQLALWSSYTALLLVANWQAIIAAMVLSRPPMAVLMSVLPNARRSGLSSTVGQPARWAALVSVILSVLIAGFLLGDFATLVTMVTFVTLATVAIGVLAKRKIGGQTGDILGTAQQCALLCAVMAAQM